MMLECPKPSNRTKATLFDRCFIPMLEACGACGLSYADEKCADSKTSHALNRLRFVRVGQKGNQNMLLAMMRVLCSITLEII